MKIPMAGGCLCGEVRYQVVAEPIKMANCHCRSCQKWSGSAYLALLFVPEQALQVTGSYKEFPTMAASGNTVFRAFCAHCGTPLFGRNSVFTKLRPVAAATLDEPGLYRPELDMWVADAQSWDTMNAALPKYPGNFW